MVAVSVQDVRRVAQVMFKKWNTRRGILRKEGLEMGVLSNFTDRERLFADNVPQAG